MPDFRIIRTNDSSRYRDQIVEFWRAYLPGTPPGRFEWMTSGNPAGPAIWFLAFEHGSDEIAGMASLMPRKFHLMGRELHAGILGDFMVAMRHRVFGPNIQLLRSALAAMGDLGFSFIYTLPNEASFKVAEHVGMRSVAELCCLAKPIDMPFYLKKRAPYVLAEIIAPVADFYLRITSQEIFRCARRSVKETVAIDDSFDRFWERMRVKTEELVGDRSADYLRWRYLRNPLNRFRFLVCADRSDREIGGYAVFFVNEENKMDIYDIVAIEKECSDSLRISLIKICRKERRRALYFVAANGSLRLKDFRRFRFLNTESVQRLYCHGGAGIPLDRWDFSSGDRNI